MRTIYLPATGKHIRFREYVRAWKFVKDHPEQEFKHGLETWWPQLGKEIYADFLKGMHDRINTRTPMQIYKYSLNFKHN
jgi:hypothetical protein